MPQDLKVCRDKDVAYVVLKKEKNSMSFPGVVKTFLLVENLYS